MTTKNVFNVDMASSFAPRRLLAYAIEHYGFPLLFALNLAVVVVLTRAQVLSEWSVLAVHYANILALVAFETIHPLNRAWLIFDPGAAPRWRLFAKTYLWYLFDSRIWFLLHGLAVYKLALFISPNWESIRTFHLPIWAQCVALAIIIDFTRYWIHRAAHNVPWLWRFHQMHHAPTHMTPVRAWWTHPIDDVILYSFEIFVFIIAGFDPVAILAYVSFDNFFQLINHSNAAFRRGWLNELFQHPATHLLHHQRHLDARGTLNYGEMFTLWDRLFGTFGTAEFNDMRSLEIGIEGRQSETLWQQLVRPILLWRQGRA